MYSVCFFFVIFVPQKGIGTQIYEYIHLNHHTMEITEFPSETILTSLKERICRPITGLETAVNSESSIWDAPVKMCKEIENEPLSIDSIISNARKYNKPLNVDNTIIQYHVILTRLYILLYFRHGDDKLLEVVVYPRLLGNIGRFYKQQIETIKERINKFKDDIQLAEQYKNEKKQKPLYGFEGLNRTQMQYLHNEYNHEKLFRVLAQTISDIIEKYKICSDNVEVWCNAKKIVLALRDNDFPELIIDRILTDLVAGQACNGYRGSQAIMLCVYAMVLSIQNGDHFKKFVTEMERLSASRKATEINGELNVLSELGNIKGLVLKELPYDDYDYIQDKSNAEITGKSEEEIHQYVYSLKMEYERQIEQKDQELKQKNGEIESLKQANEDLLNQLQEAEKIENINAELEEYPRHLLILKMLEKCGADTSSKNHTVISKFTSIVTKSNLHTCKHIWEKNNNQPVKRQPDLIREINTYLSELDIDIKI